jgi:hypothetical protein
MSRTGFQETSPALGVLENHKPGVERHGPHARLGELRVQGCRGTGHGRGQFREGFLADDLHVLCPGMHLFECVAEEALDIGHADDGHPVVVRPRAVGGWNDGAVGIVDLGEAPEHDGAAAVALDGDVALGLDGVSGAACPRRINPVDPAFHEPTLRHEHCEGVLLGLGHPVENNRCGDAFGRVSQGWMESRENERQ